MSYWKNEELASIKQTQVSIPSANGLSYNDNQRIDLHIPPNIKLFDGRNTYLNFDVKLQMPAGLGTTRLCLDPIFVGIIIHFNFRDEIHFIINII